MRDASRTAWDPSGIPATLTTLGHLDAATDNRGVPNWLSTQPAPDHRVQQVHAAVQEASIAPEQPRPGERLKTVVAG